MPVKSFENDFLTNSRLHAVIYTVVSMLEFKLGPAASRLERLRDWD